MSRRNSGLKKNGKFGNGPIGGNGLIGSTSNQKNGWAERVHNGPSNSTSISGPIGQSVRPEMNGPKQQRGRPWCEHYRKPGHKDTC